VKSLTSLSSRHNQRDRFLHRKLLVAEISIKLLVNCLLISVGAATLVKLLPHHFSQLTKLQEISLAVERTENRVNVLRTKFNSNFDPQRSNEIAREQTSSIQADRVLIFWLKEQSNSQD